MDWLFLPGLKRKVDSRLAPSQWETSLQSTRKPRISPETVAGKVMQLGMLCDKSGTSALEMGILLHPSHHLAAYWSLVDHVFDNIQYNMPVGAFMLWSMVHTSYITRHIGGSNSLRLRGTISTELGQSRFKWWFVVWWHKANIDLGNGLCGGMTPRCEVIYNVSSIKSLHIFCGTSFKCKLYLLKSAIVFWYRCVHHVLRRHEI